MSTLIRVLALLVIGFLPVAGLSESARVQPGTANDQSEDTANSEAVAKADSVRGPLDWSGVQVNVLLGMGVVPEGEYVPLSDKERWMFYAKDTFLSPNAYVVPLITVLPEQIRGYPSLWTGAGGYFKRYGARFVGYTVERSVSYPLHNVFNTEPRYIPCRCGGGFFKRFGHAVAYSYVTVDDRGKLVPNVPRFLGVYAGEYTTHAIYPGGYDPWRATRRATGTMIWGWWLNVLREFRPEIVGVFRSR